jgi:hypothetical protein
MAFDLGDPIPLPFLTVDLNGAAVDVTTAVLTITLPDATTVTPAVAHVTLGSYAPAVPYISTLAGIHRVSWVGSGANAQDFTDSFNILPADPRFLISLNEARLGLGLAAANVVHNEDLRTFVSAATPIMEDLVGPALPASRVETYDGGRPKIVLLWSPLLSVSSVVESYGTFERTLTAQNIFDGSAVDAYGYTIELASGLLIRRISGKVAPFPPGVRNVQVTYVSGRSVVPGNVLLATRRLVRFLWQQEQQGFRSNAAPQTEMAYTPSGFAVPKAVIELCADSLRAQGGA